MHYGMQSASGLLHAVMYYYVLCAITGRPLLRDNGLPIIVGVAEGAYAAQWMQGGWRLCPLKLVFDTPH